jgi:hypothetical protein
MSDLKTQLREDMAEIDWKSLIPHAQRDALIVVNASLDLVEVAFALAQDDVAQVEYWIREGLIHKPTVDELGAWNQDSSRQFLSLIVQPFVLVRG